MENTLLQEKIASLPAHIRQQVADYIDFLVEKHQKVTINLTEEERQLLEERYLTYLNNPANTVDLEEVKNRLMNKYGLSNQD